MSRPFSQTLTRFREKLASNRVQSSPDYLSLYSDRARPIESQFEFSRIVLILIFLVCLFGTPSACGARQASADPSETRLAEGIKLLGEGRHLESVEVLNSAKQRAPQDARPYFYCGMALAQAGRMRDAASEVGEAVHLAPEQRHYRVFQAHVLEQLKQRTAAQAAVAAFQNGQTWIRREFRCFRSKWPKIRHLSPKYLQQSLDFHKCSFSPPGVLVYESDGVSHSPTFG